MVPDIHKLKEYSKLNNRICPIPKRWNDLFKLLKNKTAKEPSLPLILAAWWETGAIFKQLRFFEHLDWADKQNQLDEISKYIYGLSEEEWFHNGD